MLYYNVEVYTIEAEGNSMDCFSGVQGKLFSLVGSRGKAPGAGISIERKGMIEVKVFDGHSDLLYDVTRRRLAGETRVLERHHLERLRRGGIEGLMLAFWYNRGPHDETFWKDVPGAESPAARLEIMFRCARAELAQCPWLALVRSAQEAEAARAAGTLYAFFAVEGLSALGEDPSGIDLLADLGVRVGMLTWNEENAFASGAAQDPGKGLTPLGLEAVRRMEARGILPDVSHLNDAGFRDLINAAHGPVIASHSNCRALCDVPRNLTDEQLRAIRDTGGLVGLNVHHAFVHRDPALQTVETLARHAVHIAERIGVEHVACGFDFCEYMGPGNDGAKGLEDCSGVPELFRWLERFGMSETERRRIARENFLQLL